MVSYKSLEHNLSNRHKIYALYNLHNFAVVEIVPLPLEKLGKMAFFVEKCQLTIISRQSWIVFMSHVSDISLPIKLGPTIRNKWKYVVKKLEK